MKTLLRWLDGKKTYIVALIGIGIVGFFYMRGEVSAQTAMPAMLGFVGLGTMRGGVKKAETPTYKR